MFINITIIILLFMYGKIHFIDVQFWVLTNAYSPVPANVFFKKLVKDKDMRHNFTCVLASGHKE